MTERRHEIWIDRGGTFTDCVRRDRDTGEVRVVKLPSSDRAPLDGIRQLLDLAPLDPIPPCDVRMGTTVATNALLERQGAPCALVTTRGFGDLPRIGTQTRSDLFRLAIETASPLYREVLEVDARADAQGRVLERPDEANTRAALHDLRARGIESVAVVVVHAYASSELELELGRWARDAGFDHVTLSHQAAAELGLLGRGDTAMVDAYLTPLLQRYLGALNEELVGSSLRLMQSSGTLVDAARFRGPAALLSGPAGGVVAAARVALGAGQPRAIAFDMGGTSTDVSRYDGTFARIYETTVAGIRVRSPLLDIHTVAAGGGSICRYNGRRFQVGPDSAGASPGPLCYGHPDARYLTVTDLNLVLGRLQPDRFPLPLQTTKPWASLATIAQRMGRDGATVTAETVASGFLQVTNHNMAEAIRRVSVARGYDPSDHALVVFGGAGGQHACAVARHLGITTLLCHPWAGVLSALGMGLAEIGWHGSADAGRRAVDASGLASATGLLDGLEEQARSALALEGIAPRDVRVRRLLDLRYRDSETALTLALGTELELHAAFEHEHHREFGYARSNHPLELVAVRLEASATGSDCAPGKMPPLPSTSPGAPLRRTRVWMDDGWQEAVPIYRREHLSTGTRLRGPALILEATGTTVVDPDFELEVATDGVLVLRDRCPSVQRQSLAFADHRETGNPDPVELEVMAHRFMSIAEQMGHVLRRTALSTNIRERLDFSCGVFDASGNLVANAPHIPVHLGAMSETVRAVLTGATELSPGDQFITNDPSAGGSHLPDLTVVKPIHDSTAKLRFFVAARGHHADIGGIVPGSMPARSHTLTEEGVLIPLLRVVHGGQLDQEAILSRLTSGPYPARNPQQNLADLKAQIAACQLGERLLGELASEVGLPKILSYMGHVQDDAAAAVATAIGNLSDGQSSFVDYLDDGSPIAASLRVSGQTLVIDFSGTAPQSSGNLNAPRAVTVAAVLYFLRALVNRPVPLNSGCLRSIELIVPPHSLLCPDPDRAVAGGNVETSQRVVDVLLGAAGLAAASQGTMNNLCFGNAAFGYYETIGGGAGAGPDFDGASGVHTHMTNTRATDPEVLESRYPVRLRCFALRHGSGGVGRRRGGDGLVRELEFLEPLDLSVLSQRRERPPFGLAGGSPGAPGRNLLNGHDLGGIATVRVEVGNRLRIETPGGGGYGCP